MTGAFLESPFIHEFLPPTPISQPSNPLKNLEKTLDIEVTSKQVKATFLMKAG